MTPEPGENPYPPPSPDLVTGWWARPSTGPRCGTTEGRRGSLQGRADWGSQLGGGRVSRNLLQPPEGRGVRRQVCTCCGLTASGPGSSCSHCVARAQSWARTWAGYPLPGCRSPCPVRCLQPSLAPPSTQGGGGCEMRYSGSYHRVPWGAGHLPTTLSSKFRNCFTQAGCPTSRVTVSKP